MKNLFILALMLTFAVGYAAENKVQNVNIKQEYTSTHINTDHLKQSVLSIASKESNVDAMRTNLANSLGINANQITIAKNAGYGCITISFDLWIFTVEIEICWSTQ